MAVTLSDLDLDAMDTINYTIDEIMTLPDEEYIEASAKILGVVRQYLGTIVSTSAGDRKPLIFDPEGGRA
jgi:hypothetical protein